MPYTNESRNKLIACPFNLESNIEDYSPYIGDSGVESLRRLAGLLEGKTWVSINSTFHGGGVAEMLRSTVPFARGLGVDARWYGIEGEKSFFQVTKKFHNLLQGVEQPLALDEIFTTYLETIDRIATNLSLTADMIVVHDPQPAGLLAKGVMFGNVLWRCHIDTSRPRQAVWRFLLPYINHSDGAIFTMPDFIGPGLNVPLYEISPCIDPLAVKNRQYAVSEARDVLAPLFNKSGVDPEKPILAAISRYDIHKNQETIIKAFRKLCETRRYDPAPNLIFLGNTATDDPEGGGVLEGLQSMAGDDPGIHFFVNVEDNDRVVGALMKLASGVVHVSTREGFGLVVTEALWQGTPVIGSTVGGITKQVIDGETGFLVQPLDVDAIAAQMAWLLDHPARAQAMGANAREHVRRRFLLPELVRSYLLLLRYYAGIDPEPPRFRLNKRSYREVSAMMKARRAFMSDPYMLIGRNG
jgi:trehalose synthase